VDTDIAEPKLNPKPTRWSFAGSVVCGAIAVGASLWYSYGGESTLALAVAVSSWLLAGALGFASGYRGEHGRIHGSRLVSALLIALATLGVTVGAMVVANFRTEVRPALATPTGDPATWPALVEEAATESGHGTVLSVHCDTSTPEEGEGALCAVTFEGPRCQYWLVGSVDGTDEARGREEIDVGRGYFDAEFGPLCDWPID
jgi:hypothetical protein